MYTVGIRYTRHVVWYFFALKPQTRQTVTHTIGYGIDYQVYGMVWYGMVWYGMVWHGMVWCGMVWHGMVGYGRVWYGMV